MSHRYTLIAVAGIVCFYAVIFAGVLFWTCVRPALQAGARIN